MNKKIFTRLIKEHVLHGFPGFTLSSSQSDIFIVPMNHLYRAFMFSGSSYSTTSFRIYVATIPLYVPAEFYYCTFGQRLRDGRSDTWEWDAAEENRLFVRVREAMMLQGMPRLCRIKSPLDFARIEPEFHPQKSESLIQAIAYSLIYAGVFDEALSRMDELCKEWDKYGDDLAPWAIATRDRNKDLLGILKKEPEKARMLLMEWEQQSIKNLKLGKYTN